MKQHSSAVSLPTGSIGAMCQAGVEEYPDLFDEPIPKPQADEVLTLLKELYADGQLSVSAYWELAQALGQ